MLGLNTLSASESIHFSRLNDGKQTLVAISSIDTEKNEAQYITLESLTNSQERDPFLVLEKHDVDSLLKLLKEKEAKALPIKISELRNPIYFSNQHLCAGLNYKDHVEESGQSEGIVFFPKFGAPIGHLDQVPLNPSPLPELIDYEVEIGVVFSKDIRTPSDLKESRAAFFLTNDVSDRAIQIFYHGNDPLNFSYSFSAAKSKPGYTVVSPIISIPKDWIKFSSDIEMELFVGDQLKQQSTTSKMSLPLYELTLKALAIDSNLRWPLLDEDNFNLNPQKQLPLTNVDANNKSFISKNTLFLTGTPGGTIFQKPSIAEIIKALPGIFSHDSKIKGNTLKEKIKISLIKNAHQSGRYLKSGDKISSRSNTLAPLDFYIGSANDTP